MTCRHTDPRDRTTPMVVKSAHTDPLPADHPEKCRGCLPCPKRHCTTCRTHLLAGEPQTCVDCLAKTRRALNAILECAALLPSHALHGAHDARLVAAGPIPGGDALVMMSRGSEGLSDDADTARPDEPSPPSYILALWEERLRDALGLISRHPAWQRRPAATLTKAHQFLTHHLTWAADHHPSFHILAADLTATRTHLEELLRAGEAPARGVPCFTCGTHLERDYRSPRPCHCGPRPHPGHAPHHRPDLCCLGCITAHQWETRHRDCDQGGLPSDHAADPNAGWHCPTCNRHYRPGEYHNAVRDEYAEHATTLPIHELAERTGVPAGTIRRWASRRTITRNGEPVTLPPRLRPTGHAPDGRRAYRVTDVVALRDGVSLDSTTKSVSK